MEYRSVIGSFECEKTIEKSRFLTYVRHVEGEEAARAFLDEVRKKHPQATHVCFAYIADQLGNEQRFSDDGEPQGTAGIPILNVLKSGKIYETAVAVVRYFGGIKLGAGGLVRAYSGCAADACEGAKIGTFSRAVEICLETDYGKVNAAMKFLESEKVLSRDFATNASFTVIVKEEDAESFRARALDFFNGKVKLSEKKRYFYPF